RHKDQITKYLFKNDYVILTDLRRAYLFNREAIGKYEPFFEESFTDLLRRFRDADNIWDAIKRVEDQGIRPDLDDRFFQDLKRWHENFQEVKMLLPEGKTKRELIVLLLNKVIFIKTLEDYGLIDFRFLTDTYLRFKELWEERDLILFITRFFDEIEVWFGIYYDTELFKERFWNYVDKDPVNVAKFRDTFEAMLGTGRWEREFAQGLAHYNYRHIDEDVFGKAYETFIAEHRKDSGVYYTPRQITIYMAQKLVHDVFTPVINELIAALDKNNPNFEQAEVLMQRLYALRIIDPTSGSGSFLIKVLRQIDSEYQRITDYTAWIENSDPEAIDKQPKVFGETARFRERHNLGNHKRLTLIAQQILRHIFAADIDERALGTAKTNTWKEAVKLRPRIYNWRRFK
ncbi:MAG TPA: N-6 DNA methylase, partial [Rhabdochlamydiaceae bacterium]